MIFYGSKNICDFRNYYTKNEIETKYFPLTGGIMSGQLTIDGGTPGSTPSLFSKSSILIGSITTTNDVGLNILRSLHDGRTAETSLLINDDGEGTFLLAHYLSDKDPNKREIDSCLFLNEFCAGIILKDEDNNLLEYLLLDSRKKYIEKNDDNLGCAKGIYWEDDIDNIKYQHHGIYLDGDSMNFDKASGNFSFNLTIFGERTSVFNISTTGAYVGEIDDDNKVVVYKDIKNLINETILKRSIELDGSIIKIAVSEKAVGYIGSPYEITVLDSNGYSTLLINDKFIRFTWNSYTYSVNYRKAENLKTIDDSGIQYYVVDFDVMSVIGNDSSYVNEMTQNHLVYSLEQYNHEGYPSVLQVYKKNNNTDVDLSDYVKKEELYNYANKNLSNLDSEGENKINLMIDTKLGNIQNILETI